MAIKKEIKQALDSFNDSKSRLWQKIKRIRWMDFYFRMYMILMAFLMIGLVLVMLILFYDILGIWIILIIILGVPFWVMFIDMIKTLIFGF